MLWTVLSVFGVILAILIALIYHYNTLSNSRIESLIIGFLSCAILEFLVGISGQHRMQKKRKKNRDSNIRKAVRARLAEIDNQDV